MNVKNAIRKVIGLVVQRHRALLWGNDKAAAVAAASGGPSFMRSKPEASSLTFASFAAFFYEAFFLCLCFVYRYIRPSIELLILEMAILGDTI